MITPLGHFSLDALLADPKIAVMLPPETARALLIGIACIQPVLLHRALKGSAKEREDELLLTIPQVAKRLQVSTYRAYEMARRGILPSIRIGKSVRVKPSSLNEHLLQIGVES